MALHVAYQRTPRLAQLLDLWDAGAADEGPPVRHRWTTLALWPPARSATVAGSTGIEGNALSIEAVDAVLSGQTPAGRAADIRDVLNYNAALDLANRAALRDDFEWSQELLRRLNATILDGLEDDERGEYRTGPVVVGGSFEPPEAARVPALMRELVDWLRTDDGTDHTLVRAGLTHLNVVSIHPWLNGNGRTARVAGSLALMRRGIAAPELVNVESWIRAHPADYARVLQETHGPDYRPDDHSATPFLESFAAISVDRLDLRNRLVAAARDDMGAIVFALDSGDDPLDWAPILLAAALGTIRTSAIAATLGLSRPESGRCSPRWSTPAGSSRSGSGGVGAIAPALACTGWGSGPRRSWRASEPGRPDAAVVQISVDTIGVRCHRSEMVADSVMAETRLRERNQLTLPDAVAKAAGITEGERFVVTFDPERPDSVRLDRIRDSYAGSLADAYGDPDAYLREVREGWR